MIRSSDNTIFYIHLVNDRLVLYFLCTQNILECDQAVIPPFSYTYSFFFEYYGIQLWAGSQIFKDK